MCRKDYKLLARLLPQHQALALLRSGQLAPQGWTPSTPGEQCRTQVPTLAGSGDLLPKLGEETAPPLVQDQRAASRRAWQCYTVLVIVVTKPLWYSAGLDDEFSLEALATKPATKFLGAFADNCFKTYSSRSFPVSYVNFGGQSAMVMPTITRLWRFLTGESPLANWMVSLLAACTLQVKWDI